MWKCPGLCNEALIQNPITHNDYEVPIDGIVLRTQLCPLCGKEMGYFINCSSRRQTGFIVHRIGE